MTNAWDEVRAAIEAEDAAAVAVLVAGFDDARRREVARELPGHLPVAREAGERRDAERSRAFHARWDELRAEAARTRREIFELPGAETLYIREATRRWIEPLRVAGAGVLPGAAAVASWLDRRDLARGRDPGGTGAADDVPLILQVVAARPVAWRQDLAVRLALRLRGTRPEPDQRVRLALELLRATGAEPPVHDPLTLAWIAATRPGDLAADPLLDAMVPRLFEAEGAGRILGNGNGNGNGNGDGDGDGDGGGDDWPAALAALAADGRIRRESLLAGCRSRFLRGGQAAAQRPFVRLHERLDPAPEETAPHRDDYLALLPAAAANVADLALKQVRRLGPVPPGRAAEAVRGLLFRTEGRLVRAGLAWLDRLLKDASGEPGGLDGLGSLGDLDDLDDYAPALAAALSCASGEARERAVRLALEHSGRFTPAGAEVIRDAVAALPAYQGAELAAVFGGEVAAEPEPARFVPAQLPSVPEPAPMFPPVRDPERLLRPGLTGSGGTDAELWLDGFVRLAAGPAGGPARSAGRAP
ncbi:hypothetical protein ACFOWE_23190 [Planomonospora corallina]|uniref:Uncharacterized protein n=1 Tax=Planomonospora corallina TaxID=1806052 RepID=A0ABV8ICL1_9ACTN